MFLLFLKDMIASRSVLGKFDLQGSGLACMMLRLRRFKCRFGAGFLRTSV